MLYVVTILVCMSGLPREECTRETAYDVSVKEQVGCGIDGQATMAQTALPKEGTYVKVVCDVRGRGR